LKLTSIATPILNRKSVLHVGVYKFENAIFCVFTQAINGSDTLGLLMQRKCIQNYCS
jgi:hypothetical protein